jgi:hypothetical protein
MGIWSSFLLQRTSFFLLPSLNIISSYFSSCIFFLRLDTVVLLWIELSVTFAGVTLVEILTKGGDPYPGETPLEVLSLLLPLRHFFLFPISIALYFCCRRSILYAGRAGGERREQDPEYTSRYPSGTRGHHEGLLEAHSGTDLPSSNNPKKIPGIHSFICSDVSLITLTGRASRRRRARHATRSVLIPPSTARRPTAASTSVSPSSFFFPPFRI